MLLLLGVLAGFDLKQGAERAHGLTEYPETSSVIYDHEGRLVSSVVSEKPS